MWLKLLRKCEMLIKNRQNIDILTFDNTYKFN